jgi:hypothetical protein
MVVKCEEVWHEISNYLEGDVSPELQAAIEEHVSGCKSCTAVLDGTRNVVQLYGDERMLEVPLGFSHRLQRRLADNTQANRRSFLGWMVAGAAAVIMVGAFEVARSASFRRSEPKSEHAQVGSGVPPDLMVVVSPDTKIMHVAGCDFIHDKAHTRTIVARQALQEGYTPCLRCMKKYLNTSVGAIRGDGERELWSS